MAGKNKKKIKDLDDSTKLLRDTTEEYDDTLRSIGQHYGEINNVYKRSEKVLSLVKGEISDILSITGLLNTSNAGLVENIVKSQKGYADISKSIVKNVASLEDSESVYKNISYQIEEQKNLIKDISDELKNVDTSDEKQILAAEELKKNLIAQNDALDEMKKASDDVKRTFDGINGLSNEISNTMFGGWIDKFLKITKIAGVTSFGSISEMLDKLKTGSATDTISKITDSKVPSPKKSEESTIEPPSQAPQKGPLQVSTEKLEEEQTKYAEKTADSMKSLSSTALKDERRKSRGKRTIFGKYVSKQKAQKVESPDIEKVADEIKDNNSIQIKNYDQVTRTIENNQSDTNNSLSSVATSFKESTSENAKIETQQLASKETNVGAAAAGLTKDYADYASQSNMPAYAQTFGKTAKQLGIAAMVVGLTKEVMSFGDSMNAVITYYIGTVSGGVDRMREFTESVINQSGEDYENFKTSIQDTEEYRKLQFEYTVKANIKERQNLETDYFNYQKDVFFDYYNYQNDIIKQSIDYELGLRKDELNFQFQQQSANLDAELEKRKTLAGSAMKFIGNYAKVSERALNAIGSSTKAIMDGMKQFGAILGGTTKQQYSLIENAQGLSYSYGASADQVLNISHMFKLLGNTTENVGMGLVEGIKGFVGPTGNVQAVFNEIVEASADIYRLMSATPNEIAKQTVALQKAGVKLSSMLKASDTMVLNYKDSIKAEMSLGAMIGRNVSFNEARARLMSGDMVGAANAIREALGGVDVNQLNPFAKQELTRATGLQMDQIIQLQQTGQIETEADKQLKQAKLTGKAIADAVLNQDIANAGARLALEQKQRKEMMEFEQAQRLVTLRLEQKQKLEQIPVESAYRFYWDKVYASKFAKENMTIDALGEVLTSMLQKGNDYQGGADIYLKQLEQQQLGPNANVMQDLQMLGINYQSTKGGQISISNLQNTTDKSEVSPQLQMLGKTIVDLDNSLNQMNLSSRDPRYQKWLLGSHDIANKYKGGKTPEVAAAEYTQFFNNLFQSEVDIQKQKQQVQQQKQNEKNAEIQKLIPKIVNSVSAEMDDINVDEEYVMSQIKRFNNQSDFEEFLKQYKQKTGEDLDRGLNKSFNQNDNILLNQHLQKLGYTSLPDKDGKIAIQKVRNIETNTTVQTGVQGPVGPIPYTPPGGQSFAAGANIYAPSTPTPPGGETVSNEKSIDNEIETVKILNKIQKEADTRGILMYTKQIDQNGNLQKIITRTQNTAAAAEVVKTNTTVINQAIIPSFQNMEDIQIEMIKVLQDSRDLLAAISNKEGATTINLDGKVISDNVSTRMQNKQSFIRSNRLAVKS